jgi:hypothetical protein
MQHHAPGEPIISAIPPPVFIVSQNRKDLIFLPGPLEGTRAQRYTRLVGDGMYVDYWLGVPSIVSLGALCDAISENPDLWLIVDAVRLNDAFAYKGPMADVIRGTTAVVQAGGGGVEVRRPMPREQWDSTSKAYCEPTALSARPHRWSSHELL